MTPEILPTPTERTRLPGLLLLIMALLCGSTPAGAATPPNVDIDVMMVHTPGANAAYSGAIGTRINHLVNVTNTIYSDSEVGITLRLVHTEEVGYNDTANLSTSLSAIRYGTDGSLSHIADLRAQKGADMVVFMRLYVSGDYAGLAYIGGPGTQGDMSLWSGSMYSAVAINTSDYVTAHELGHNMGLLHSRVQDPQGGTFSFSTGHGVQSTWVTVMAYNSAYSAPTKVYRFSNPNHLWGGLPLGVFGSDPFNGADAAWSLNYVREQVAGYYGAAPGVESHAGQFGGDARCDILHHDSEDGSNYIWTTGAVNSGYGTAIQDHGNTNEWVAGVGDFDGDGDSDIVWRNFGSGANTLWQMNAGSETVTALPVETDDTWRVAGVGDFNGDGRDDLFWRNRWTGYNRFWLFNDDQTVTIEDTYYVSTVGWEFAAIGDLDGDGMADVVWRNESNGLDYAWLMNGSVHKSHGLLYQVTDLGWSIGGAGDFDADGNDDLFWRHDDGRLAVWLMNGLTDTGDLFEHTLDDTSWSFSGCGDFDGDGKDDVLWTDTAADEDHTWLLDSWSATARLNLQQDRDFNDDVVAVLDVSGDGKSDLLWRNGYAGTNGLWMMNGTSVGSTPGTNSLAGSDWTLVASGDLDGDNKEDLVWWNQVTGQVRTWLMSGSSVKQSGVPTTIDPAWNWHIIGAGDLSGDGKDDLVLRNSATGENHLFVMNGVNIASDAPIFTVSDQNWQIQGIDDFDGDGKDDLFWRNRADGTDYFWFMDGATIPGYGATFQVTDLDWDVIGSGDFDNDGTCDLFWRNASSGEVVLWTMDGTTIETSTMLGTTRPFPWSLEGVGDFNADSKADLLWLNGHTRERSVWLMDGATPTEQTSIY